MKVGIISDTHDNMNAIRKAVDVFRMAKISLLVHAGDFVAPFTIALYLEIGCDFVGVFGNNDGDRILLSKQAEGKIHNAPHEFTFGGKRFIATHYPNAVDAMAAGGAIDLVVYGHTHEPVVRNVGETLVINPGECGGWSGGKSTVAILETEGMQARIIEL